MDERALRERFSKSLSSFAQEQMQVYESTRQFICEKFANAKT